MNYQVHLTPISANVKTGKIPVSTTTKETCPNACVFKNNGCYAESGPLALHWRKVTEKARGMQWAEFCETVSAFKPGTLWRHNQAGDLPGDGETIDLKALYLLCKANAGKRGFTYTHYDMQYDVNRVAVKHANKHGFTVNLSANNLAHADALHALDIAPVVVVVDIDQTENMLTPAGNKVIICPATLRDDVSCETCQLCQRQRKTIVGFPAHGTSKKKAQNAARVIPIMKA